MSWTTAEKQWLLRHFELNDKILAAKYAQTFGAEKSLEAIKKFRQRHLLIKNRGRKKMGNDAQIVKSDLNIIEDTVLFNRVLAELNIEDPKDDQDVVEQLNEKSKTKT